MRDAGGSAVRCCSLAGGNRVDGVACVRVALAGMELEAAAVAAAAAAVAVAVVVVRSRLGRAGELRAVPVGVCSNACSCLIASVMSE